MIAKEKGCELILWNWLKSCPSVYEVYFNNCKNDVKGKVFRVEGESREIPDLLVACKLYGKEEYIAIEVKDADKGMANIFASNKILDIYYKNYIEGKTKYFILEKEIKINRFLIATQYSKFGHLFANDEIIALNGKAFNDDSEKWVNKTVPKFEYSRTKDFRSQLQKRADDARKKLFKDLNWKEAGTGILVSDSLLDKFSEEEYCTNNQFKYYREGKPLIQGVFYNFKLNRWQQSMVVI